jgi:serine/threonine protein kinase
MNAAPEIPSQDVLDPRFNILSPLRCDGPGSLDHGEDINTKSRIAIRWLPVDAGGEKASQQVAQIPMAEALPRIHARGRVGGLAYFAMDFPEGKLLSGLLGKDPMSPATLIQLGIDVAEALAKIHVKGMVHGELSPHSILVSNKGPAMLWDVPLVLADRMTERRGEERSLTKLGRMAPSMAPECARGLDVTPASDVYTLGAILCRVAGDGMPPGKTALAKINEISSGRWLPEAPASLPKAFRDLLDTACVAEPSARPTASALAVRLRAVLADLKKGTPAVEPVVAAPAPSKRAPVTAPAEEELYEEPITTPVPSTVPPEVAQELAADDEPEMISASQVISASVELPDDPSPTRLMVASFKAAALPVPAARAKPEAVVPPAVEAKPETPPAPEQSKAEVVEEAEENPVMSQPENLASPFDEPPPDESSSLEFVAPSQELALVANEGTMGSTLFGALTSEPKSRWKSPGTWLVVGVAVVLPAIILLLVFTSGSKAAKTPVAEAAAAAPVAPAPAEAAAAPVADPAPVEKAPAPAAKTAPAKKPSKIGGAPAATAGHH